MPLTVTVAVRCVVLVLLAAVTVNVPLSEPEAGVMVSHDALLPTIQFVLDVMVTARCSPTAGKSSIFVESVSMEVAASCITLTNWSGISSPLTVIVAVRCVKPGFSVAVTETVLLFDPLFAESVSQEALLTIVQSILDVILNERCSPTAEKLNSVGDTLRFCGAPAIFTCMVCVENPVPSTVIVAVCGSGEVFGLAVTVIDPFPEPELTETVSHDGALLLTVHLMVLDVIVNICCPPEN